MNTIDLVEFRDHPDEIATSDEKYRSLIFLNIFLCIIDILHKSSHQPE